MRALKVIGLIVIGLIGLGVGAVPAARSATRLPLAPTATRPAPMTPVPTSAPISVAPAAEGAYIELHLAKAQITAQPLTAKERIEHIETVFLSRSLRSLAVKNDEAEQLQAQAEWTIVQWQDGLGAWHDVEGWQGTPDEQGRVRWWVSPAQFGLGPFRWVIYAEPDGTLLAVSQPFDLPHLARQRVVVEVTIQSGCISGN